MNHVSRRSLLGAVATLPALALPAVAAEHQLVIEMRASRAAANSKFWKLSAEHQALEAEYLTCSDIDEERVGKACIAKRDEALMQPVFCPLAVLAKLKAVNFNAEDFLLPYPANTAAQMIEWDLNRCATTALIREA